MENVNKNRKYRLIIAISFVILFASSCKKNEPQPSQSCQELFWVTNKGSQMPVLMIGNKESASILLFIHGGPGESSIAGAGIYTGNSPSNLTDNFLLANWDQRYAGYSKNPDPIDWSTVNVDQYAEDCARVTDQLKIRFPGKKIIVVGHSWGGAVLTKFISNSAYQDKYNGWVVTDGMVNGFELACALQSYSRSRCNELIAEGNVQAGFRRIGIQAEVIARFRKFSEHKWNAAGERRIRLGAKVPPSTVTSLFRTVSLKTKR